MNYVCMLLLKLLKEIGYATKRYEQFLSAFTNSISYPSHMYSCIAINGVVSF